MPGLARVVPRLRPEVHPLKVERWFLQPNPDLSADDGSGAWSPRAWLIAGGDPARVADLAAYL